MKNCRACDQALAWFGLVFGAIVIMVATDILTGGKISRRNRTVEMSDTDE